MSRGVGKLQASVLELLSGTDGNTTLETLRWDLWEINKGSPRTTLPATGKLLPNSWNTSIARAIYRLVECDPKRIILTERKLTSTAEFLLHYPNKTLSVRTRFLRRELLPILLDGTNPEFHSMYSRARNESYYHSQRSSSTLIHDAAKIWRQCEAALIKLLPTVSGEDQRLLFLLICKAKYIVFGEEVTARGAFADYADAIIEKGVLPAALSARVNALRGLLLPKEQEEHLNLKSKLYSVVNFGSRGSNSSLKDKSVAWLDSRRPELVRKLPGYKAPSKPGRGWVLVNPLIECPELDKLIDATALQKFRFLRVK